MKKNLLKVIQTFLIVLIVLMQSMAQNSIITGSISSVTGEVVPGVSIQIIRNELGYCY